MSTLKTADKPTSVPSHTASRARVDRAAAVGAVANERSSHSAPPSADGSVTSYLYQGNCTTITDPAGKWKTYTSDAMGNLTQSGGAKCEITGVLKPFCRRSAPSVRELERDSRGTCGIYQFRHPGREPCQAGSPFLLYYGFSHSRKGIVCP